jgi:hypothetical protein
MDPLFRFVVLLTVSLPLASALVAQDAPRTPGSVAMLVAAEGVEADLAAALSDGDARVRAAAARVINVRALAGLLPSLRDALRVEEDLDAARELLRAVGLLGGSGEIGFLMEQAGPLGPAFRAEALVAAARVNSVETLSWYFAGSQENLLSRRPRVDSSALHTGALPLC